MITRERAIHQPRDLDGNRIARVGITTDTVRCGSNLRLSVEVKSMTEAGARNMPDRVAEIAECGFATWATDDVDDKLRARFATDRIPVAGVRQVRIWGLQVDDERELPTQVEVGHISVDQGNVLRGLRGESLQPLPRQLQHALREIDADGLDRAALTPIAEKIGPEKRLFQGEAAA